ncbi:MAG: hypothetical protein LQ343_001739 [Gyalolechia ehrenbergii]|nr:MAG: hypothetical protein LQ343_001739 [Gyalolechia ehrenbergii]
MDTAPSDNEALLDPSEAAEIVPDDPDHPMDSDDEDIQTDGEAQEEFQLQNDSIAYFDLHTDSIFCIANHPLTPTIIATGGGDDTTYIFSADVPSPVLPPSYESNPSTSRSSLQPIAKLTGHTDSINTLTYTLPTGEYLITGGLDGQIRVHSTKTTSPTPYSLLSSAQEVPEVNFLTPSPHPSHLNTFALGASDGSVWVYTIDASDPSTPLQVLQAYYLHTESCTAGAWTPNGKLLATVSEDGSFYVWDPFGEATAAGVTNSSSSSSSGQAAIVGLTTTDQRFAVEGGLFSVAIAPSGAFAAVGGAHGIIRVVGLPRLSSTSTSASATKSLNAGGGAKNKTGGGKKASGPLDTTSGGSSSSGQAGAILASLQVQSESIETLAFSPHHSLLAAGSVDGSICLFDTAHRFAVRRHIKEAHEDAFAVVQVAFGASSAEEAWLLTSCGMDGAVRRWDCRGGAGAGTGAGTGAGAGADAGAVAGVTGQHQQGLAKEWRGHRGEGEGGGVLGFVMSGGGNVVTAGDDGVSLVFAS